MARTYSISLVAFATLSFASAAARADAAYDADLRTFRPSTDRRGSLATEPIATPGAWNLQFQQWATFETASLRHGDTRVLGPRLILDPTVQIGIGRRAAIGATLPVVAQGGDASPLTEGRPVPTTGIGDVTLTGKAAIKEWDPMQESGGWSFGVVSRLSLPTGDRTSFVSDRASIVEARMLASYTYFVLTVTATAGYRMRFANHEVTGVTLGDSVPWGATLSLKPLPNWGLDTKRWTIMLEGRGEIGTIPNKLFASSRVSPAFAGASVRYEITDAFSLFGGFEKSLTDALGAPSVRFVFGLTYAPTIVDEDHDGVPDDVDDCVGLPEDGQGPQPHDGCPDYGGEQTHELPPIPDPEPPPVDPTPPPVASSDADADGIPDDVDKCPDQPETKNGYEDDDGCPESDKDGDTFLDAVDHCPDKPETFNGHEDDDGCPDELPAGAKKVPPLVTETKPKDGKGDTTLVLARTLAFDGNTPAKEATADLRAVAAWLLAHPGARVKVAVKPDGKGDDAAKLANERAAAVVDALVRYAHTGNVAEAMAWDPKSTAKTNVIVVVVAGASADAAAAAPKSEPAKPEPDAKKPDAKKAEPAKPDAKKAEPAKPDAKKADAPKPEAPKPEPKKPEAAKPEAPKPDAKKPEPPKTDAGKP